MVLPDNPVAAYNFQNVGLLGIGTLDGVDGVDVNFRSIASANAALTVTLDAGNNAIILTLDIGSIIDDLPQATTTQRGVGETATNAEAIAKVSTTVFVTPSNFAAMGSSTTFAGLVELATDGETQTGTSTTLAVTPAGLASVIALQQGTETWANAVARAAAVPDFAGQVGVQLDTDVLYIATGTVAGDFDMPVFMLGNTLQQIPLAANTTLDLNGTTITLSGPGTLAISNGGFSHDGGTASFNNGIVRFGDSASEDFDFGAQCRVRVANVTVPANSVFITTGTGGEVSSALISTFLSDVNQDTGWTNFTNSAIRKTGDCNTITLPQLAQVVDTLIQTLGTSLQTPIP